MGDQGKMGVLWERWKQHVGAKLRSGKQALREILYGFTVHGLEVEFRKERDALEHLFMLVVFGGLIGLPLLPPYYSMRLLPSVVPSLRHWNRRKLREKDLTDLASVGL